MGKVKVIFLGFVLFLVYVGFCEGLYFDAKDIHLSGRMKSATLDFSMEGSSIESQQISLDGSRHIGVDFGLVNTGNSDIYIRLNVVPVICDANDQEVFYKMSNFEIVGLEQWQRGDDGYYYYINSLAEGESVEEEFEAEVDFNKRLEGDIKLYLYVESIQARNNFRPVVWGEGGM